MEASPRHCFFLGLGTQGREPWWVHGLDLLQHGQKSAASSSGQAAPWFPPVLPLQPSLLHPAAPSAPHIVCHSDRFKQTRLGLIRLRLRFLQRFAGAGQRKALGRGNDSKCLSALWEGCRNDYFLSLVILGYFRTICWPLMQSPVHRTFPRDL